MRFANHASQKFENCSVKIKYTNGAYEYCLYSNRDIKANEELIFDYVFEGDDEYDWLKEYR
jgi:SET domain-containing protein